MLLNKIIIYNIIKEIAEKGIFFILRKTALSLLLSTDYVKKQTGKGLILLVKNVSLVKIKQE